jgi:hypothetical protein
VQFRACRSTRFSTTDAAYLPHSSRRTRRSLSGSLVIAIRAKFRVDRQAHVGRDLLTWMRCTISEALNEFADCIPIKYPRSIVGHCRNILMCWPTQHQRFEVVDATEARHFANSQESSQIQSRTNSRRRLSRFFAMCSTSVNDTVRSKCLYMLATQ